MLIKCKKKMTKNWVKMGEHCHAHQWQMCCYLCICVVMAVSHTIWDTVPGACEARVSWLGGHADDYCFPALSPLSDSANPAVAPHWTQNPSSVHAGSATKHTILTYLGYLTYRCQNRYFITLHTSLIVKSFFKMCFSNRIICWEITYQELYL